MEKKFEETTLGKFINRFSNTGEIGTMSHSVETKTIILFGVMAVTAGVILFAIKKYIFK